jgi:NADH/NAD ratio-sensing transcriptional regulator Rex
MDKLQMAIRQLCIKMAIIATSAENTVVVSKLAVRAGIQVIWNFSHVTIPEIPGVLIHNTNSILNLEEDYFSIMEKL